MRRMCSHLGMRTPQHEPLGLQATWHNTRMDTPTSVQVQTKSAAGIAWNLSASLFQAIDDLALTEAMAQAKTDVAAFEQKYRSTVKKGPTATHLLQALQEAESLQTTLIKIQSYAGLIYAADTSKNEHRALLQQVEELMTALRNQMLFFDLEWLEVPDAKAQKLIANKKLAKYAHYLANERKSKPRHLEVRRLPARDLLRDTLGGLALFAVGLYGVGRALRRYAGQRVRDRLGRWTERPAG